MKMGLINDENGFKEYKIKSVKTTPLGGIALLSHFEIFSFFKLYKSVNYNKWGEKITCYPYLKTMR